MKEKRSKKNCGFSMVEIIIVITIMAILGASLSPMLFKYVAKAKRSTDVQNASAIGRAAQLAMVDSEVAQYVYTQTMPYSVEVENLNTNDIFENFIYENIGAAPEVKYKKTGGVCYVITIDTSNEINKKAVVEVAVKGAPATDTSSISGNDWVVLFPIVDSAYQDQ